MERLEERYDREKNEEATSSTPLSPMVEEFLQGLGSNIDFESDLGSDIDTDDDPSDE